MFEQAFKNIDDVLWKEAGCTTELDYTEQTSWLLFLKYLDGLEQDRADEAALSGKKYAPRPLIRAVIKIVQAEIDDRIYDGACADERPNNNPAAKRVPGCDQRSDGLCSDRVCS